MQPQQPGELPIIGFSLQLKIEGQNAGCLGAEDWRFFCLKVGNFRAFFVSD
jgi:hypothetical protein